MRAAVSTRGEGDSEIELILVDGRADFSDYYQAASRNFR
jgi:hypothetical protein